MIAREERLRFTCEERLKKFMVFVKGKNMSLAGFSMSINTCVLCSSYMFVSERRGRHEGQSIGEEKQEENTKGKFLSRSSFLFSFIIPKVGIIINKDKAWHET